MSKHIGSGILGLAKHRKSGTSGPSGALKAATTAFFNREEDRKKRRKQKMYDSVREALSSARKI